jgi:hypothetical protein
LNSFNPFVRLSAVTVERETEAATEETERLAALFAQAIPQPLQYQLGLPEESSESWQGGVGSLTLAEQLAPLCAAAGAPDARTDDLVFSLNAGDLGTLKCKLERTEAGLRVVIGADGRNALTALGAECNALELALRAAGFNVRSIAVVPLSKFGTVLARGGEAPDGRPVRHAQPGSRQQRSRRLKFIG